MTREEIIRIASLMRVELGERELGEHVDKVRVMMDYFERLRTDSSLSPFAGTLVVRLDELRADSHERFERGLGRALDTEEGGYVRSPGER